MLQTIEKYRETPFIFFFSIIIIVALAIIHKAKPQYFPSVFKSLLFEQRAYTVSNSVFSFDFILVFLLFTFTFFITYLTSELIIKSNEFLKIAFSFIVYLIAELLFIRVFSITFNLPKQVMTRLFYFSIHFFTVVGILTLPLSILVTYGYTDIKLIFKWFFIIILIILFIFKVFKKTIILENHLSFFHLFLYLCTLEILPLLILIRVLN